MQYFKGSIIITCLGLLAAFLWGGVRALVLTAMLSILEISLSFDNAVVNTTVLQKMSELWRTRFLTWGILIAVFGVRFILPVLIVSLVAELGLLEVFSLAFQNPQEYAKHLHAAKVTLSTFGGIFLWLVFLNFIFDKNREIHWLRNIEKPLKKLRNLRFTERLVPIIGLVTLMLLQIFILEDKQIQSIIAGIIAIVSFVILDTLITTLSYFETRIKHIRSGFMQFMYLEVLDASFSLDGVVGAFAITEDIVVILLGLSIGAIFVRSMSIFLAHRNTLKKYIYLEHGAHYAIGALALMMLLSTRIEIPEVVTGLIGVIVIGLSLISSIRYNRVK